MPLHSIIGQQGRGLFVEYINTFLKIKTETSGYPSRVLTPSDEDRYIEEFWQSEGIHLNKSIGYNASKRGLAKLCLNSLWGKLCENPVRTQTQMISDPKELYRFLATPGMEVATLLFAGYSMCWVGGVTPSQHTRQLSHIRTMR